MTGQVTHYFFKIQVYLFKIVIETIIKKIEAISSAVGRDKGI